MQRTRRHLIFALVGWCGIIVHILTAQTSFPKAGGDSTLVITNDFQSFIDRGVQHLHKQDWEKAINEFSAAIRLNTNSALAYTYRGASYAVVRDWGKAIDDLDQAIHLEPSNATNYFNRSSCYSYVGQIDYALADLNEVLRLNPNYTEAHKARASNYLKKNEFEKALNDLNAFLKLTPGDAVALSMRADCQAKTGRFDAAAKDFREANRLNQMNHNSRNGLAWLLATCPVATIRNGRQATSEARLACDLTGWSRWAYLDTLAAAHAEAGDFKDAIEVQKMALDMTGLRKEEKERMRSRLALYEKHQPYHESPSEPK